MTESKKRGLIHIYCGDGKGKTTAAMGLSVRAAGAGMCVVLTQFLKSGDSSEIGVLREISGIHIYHEKRKFGFFWNMSQEEKQEAKMAYFNLFDKVCKQSVDTNADILIMDEFIGAYNHGWIPREKALEFLNNKPEKLEVVMTGREPAKELCEAADYITEMRKIKHPYDEGIPARKGIEL